MWRRSQKDLLLAAECIVDLHYRRTKEDGSPTVNAQVGAVLVAEQQDLIRAVVKGMTK